MTDSARDDVILSSPFRGDSIVPTSSEKSPLMKTFPSSPYEGFENAELAPSKTHGTRQYRKSASDVPKEDDDEDSSCCAFNFTATGKDHPAPAPDVNCNDFLTGMGKVF